MNIVLIGYRGTGKSAVGRLLADRLDLDFYDADEIVEKRGGQSIQKMVAAKGWEFFRELEKDVIRELSGIDAAVIATGGGAVLDPENVRLLKHKGRLIWLDADAQTVIARMQADTNNEQRRPSLTGSEPADETGAVMATRAPFYREAADICVDTSGKSLDEIVDEICSKLAS
ncbi:MAG: shikimate kinase [Deltaproteobacteria bacterium HGW-Deltaproteobacteria-11]|nr:MAG: shikimate kinase [Deltaproteobacteria bacterium HGW-Deltaproteobacteria-11]